MQTLMGQNLFLFVDIFKRRIYLNLLANNDTNKVFIIGIHNIKFLTSVETKLKMFKGTVSVNYMLTLPANMPICPIYNGTLSLNRCLIKYALDITYLFI